MITKKKKKLKMSLALVVLGISMVLGCPPSSNSTGDGGGRGSDTTAPTLQSSSPSEGSTTFSAGANITLTYSEPVLVGTGEITLEYSDGTTITIMVDVTGSQVSIAGPVVTINPTNDLDLGNTHALVIPAGAFKDAAGNTTAENTISFMTAAALDTDGPMLSSSVPVDGATMVEVGANIVLTYSEAVQAATTGSITITPTMPAGSAIPISVGDPQVTFAGPVVTINPANNLLTGTQYTLTVEAGAIEDASGNPGGVATFSFTTVATPDTTAPTVSSSVPVDGATAVLVGTNIVLTYSEEVNITTGDITITPTGGGMVIMIPADDSIQVTRAGRVVTIDPTNNLEDGTMYTVEIPQGAIVDINNNPAPRFMLRFNTLMAARTIPSLMSSVPSSGATNFAITANIVLTYSEAVQAGTGNITLAASGGGATIPIAVTNAQVSITGAVVTINPTNDLVEGTTYTLTVPAGAIESSDDQTPAGVSTLSFTTVADMIDPFVSSSVPDSGETIQATENIVLTFNETVTVGSGVTTFSFSQGGSTTHEIDVTDSNGQVTIADNVVTINPSINLTAGQTAALIIPVGVFVDLAGNDSVEYTLDFVVAPATDNLAPTLMSSDPDNGDRDVPLDSDIVLTYNETVQAGSGNITITPASGDVITIAVTDGQVTIAGAVVTIDPDGDLVGNTMYTVSIPAGAIRDNATTPNATTTPATLSFTTIAPTRRVVLWVGGKDIEGRLIGFQNDRTGCQGKPSESVATGAFTKRFLATGNGANQNPVNFTVDDTPGGDLLSGYSGATPVYAAHSATLVLTDNDLIANSYTDLISPTTPLLRTLNQAGLNDGNSLEGERSSIENFTFWTGLNNLTSSGYVAGPACIVGGSYWNPASTGSAGAGASNIVVKTPTPNSAVTASDVFGRQFGCITSDNPPRPNSYNVLCITY